MTEILEYSRDDLLLKATGKDGKPRIRIERFPQVAVVLGRGSKPELELNTDAIEADGVKVYRRTGGGCSVVLDPGNIIVSVILPVPGLGGIKKGFCAISEMLIGALEKAGVPGVRQEGVSDLVLDDRKIGGSCIYRARDILYYSTTLLVDPDLDLSERYLKHPPREPEYRKGRRHRDFMGSISGAVGHVDVDGFINKLGASMTPVT